MAYTDNHTPASVNNLWVARPLAQKGDLNSWLKRMHSVCPNPSVGEIV